VRETNKVIETLTSMAKNGQADELSTYIKSLPALFAEHRLTIKDLEYIWNQMVSYSLINHAENPIASSLDFSDFEQIIEQFDSYPAFGEYMLSQLVSLMSVSHPPALDHAQFKKLLRYIGEHYTENLLLKDLAKKFYLNPNYCCLLFKKYINISFSEHLNTLRLDEAKKLLGTSDLSTSEIAYQCGYNDYYYFSKIFKKTVGATPKNYRAHSKKI
jgi:YesN/AraC family two-component response regulator